VKSFKMENCVGEQEDKGQPWEGEGQLAKRRNTHKINPYGMCGSWMMCKDEEGDTQHS